jgi:hypothetical protein
VRSVNNDAQGGGFRFLNEIGCTRPKTNLLPILSAARELPYAYMERILVAMHTLKNIDSIGIHGLAL